MKTYPSQKVVYIVSLW